jgi:glycosyltransferase involved in cell wall biosynthesis
MVISVCLASFNGQKYIKEQIDSILVQLSYDDELIVSDDGSTDNTFSIIANYNDARIKVFHNENKKGVVGNFENALKHAQGDYIFLSDQDDVWLKDKVTVCLDHLNTVDLVNADCKIVDSELNLLEDSFFISNNSKNGILNTLRHNAYMGCCMAFNRKILSKILPFPKDIPLHDLWIGFVCDLFYKSLLLSVPLILYRRHSLNVSKTTEKSPYSFLRKMLFRWNIIKYVPLLLFRK